MSPASRLARTLPDLCARLVDLRNDGHWCCSNEFLELTGLDVADMAKHCGRGRRELWLDIIATEVATLFIETQGSEELPDGWKKDAVAWADAAFEKAFTGTVVVPPRAIPVTRAAWLVKDISSRCRGSVSRQSLPRASVKTSCTECGYAYPPHVESCPQCARKRRDAELLAEEAQLQARELEWQTLDSAPLASDDSPTLWHDALEWRHCHGGSGGVFMLRLPSGVACIKGLLREEVFAESLAAKFGVRVAMSRQIRDTAERSAILHAFRQSIPLRKDAMDMLYLLPRGDRMRALEYIRGVPMQGLPAHQCLVRLAAVGKDASSPHYVGAQNAWRELGRLMAFDVVINNFDRLPLVWSNEGNLANIMLSGSADETLTIVGIDQKVSPILHQAGLTAYLGKVKAMVRRLSSDSWEDFESVKVAVQSNTLIELGESELVLIREGLLGFLREVCDLHETSQLDSLLWSCMSKTWDQEAQHQQQNMVSMVRSVVESVHAELGSRLGLAGL
mmetsp:Transcript_1914/g.4898  ORF Transcript_1914/g.4898 Transcript_1914/m.4898 type:complete len:505 (-) Transcript_1914:6-1520(-)